MLNKGMICENNNTLCFDKYDILPDSLKKMINNNCIDDFLNSDIFFNNLDYLHYVLHSISFKVSSKFEKNYILKK